MNETEIEALRKAVCRFDDTALNFASKKKASESLPVIVKVLEKILEVHAKKENADLNSLYFLNRAINYLKFSIHCLNKTQNTFKLIKLLWDIKDQKEKMLREFNDIHHAAGKVETTNEDVHLWREASFWLRATFKHTDDIVRLKDIKPNAHGTIGPIDNEDRLFASVFGLTKHQVALKYAEIADAIDGRLPEFKTKPNNHFFKISRYN